MRSVAVLMLLFVLESVASAADPSSLKLLFLGDHGIHRPAERYVQIAPVLAKRNIELKYNDDPEVALSAETLSEFDGLVLYANIDAITSQQEKVTAVLKAGMRRIFIRATMRRTARFWNTECRVVRRTGGGTNLGHGSALKAKERSSIPLGDTTSGHSGIPASTILWSAASAGPAGRIRQSSPNLSHRQRRVSSRCR